MGKKTNSHKGKTHKTQKNHSLEVFLRNHSEEYEDKIVTTLSNQMLKSILPKQTEALNHF